MVVSAVVTEGQGNRLLEAESEGVCERYRKEGVALGLDSTQAAALWRVQDRRNKAEGRYFLLGAWVPCGLLHGRVIAVCI